MPRVTCPNCGMTISLQNRKKLDFNLITSATKRSPRTFTELLHITRLSRKTLSLRLKELSNTGVLIKNEGMYQLNGASEFKGFNRDLKDGFSKVLHERKLRTGLMLIAFLMCSSVSGYVLATFFLGPQLAERRAIGDVMMSLEISNVNDLCGWQVVIAFDSNDLEIAKVTSGGFVGVEYPLFVNASDVGDGLLVLAGFLPGNTPGKSGNGTLAYVTFNYFVTEYEAPSIVSRIGVFETRMWDSTMSLISDTSATLELMSVQN